MAKKQLRKFKQQLRKSSPAKPSDSTPLLSPQNEALLKELRAFASDVNSVLLAVEHRMHAKGMFAGLKAGADQSSK